jgi:Lrp/AsnC family transcriptional regulator for asnA, asnC and gidA
MILDAIDRRIIEKLTEDARLPLVHLAKKLKVSNTLVHQRIKKLNEKGILQNASYKLDPSKLGYETSAYTQIKLDSYELRTEIEKQVATIDEIVECVNISGEYAILVKIYARNNRHLRDIIYDKIQTIKGVSTTNTIIAFETNFTRNVPLEIEWGEVQ